jgi:hypothetical protein
LDRFVGNPQQAEQRQQERQWCERIAKALDRSVDTVQWQLKHRREYLFTEIALARIDPTAGLRVNIEALGVPEDAEFPCTHQELRQALQQQGIVTPVVQPPPDDCRELRDTCHNA